MIPVCVLFTVSTAAVNCPAPANAVPSGTCPSMANVQVPARTSRGVAVPAGHSALEGTSLIVPTPRKSCVGSSGIFTVPDAMIVPALPSSVNGGTVPGGNTEKPGGSAGRLSREGGVVGNGGNTDSVIGDIEFRPTRLMTTPTPA